MQCVRVEHFICFCIFASFLNNWPVPYTDIGLLEKISFSTSTGKKNKVVSEFFFKSFYKAVWFCIITNCTSFWFLFSKTSQQQVWGTIFLLMNDDLYQQQYCCNGGWFTTRFSVFVHNIISITVYSSYPNMW